MKFKRGNTVVTKNEAPGYDIHMNDVTLPAGTTLQVSDHSDWVVACRDANGQTFYVTDTDLQLA